MSDFAVPWTVAHQAPLSVEFSRQEHWGGLLFPAPGDLPDPGIEPASLSLLHWQVGSLLLVPPGKPFVMVNWTYFLTVFSRLQLPILMELCPLIFPGCLVPELQMQNQEYTFSESLFLRSWQLQECSWPETEWPSQKVQARGGWKKCSPRCTWYPSHITVFFSKMFLLWLLPWNPVYLKSLRRVYVKGWDNVAFPKDKRSYLIRAESLFYQAFPGNPFLCLFWFIFNNHPFLVRVIQICKNLSYPGIWGRKVGFSVWCSLLLDCVCDDWASSLLLVQCPDSFPITVGCARPPCVTKVAPGLRGWSIMGSHGREVQSSWQGGWGFYEKLCLAWKSSIEVTFGDH